VSLRKLTDEDKEHTYLTWRIIEWKVAYYMPEKVHPTWGTKFEVADDIYDQSEIRYLELCRKLGLPNTLVHKGYPGFEDVDHSRAMFEVDLTRPSVQLVMRRMSGPMQ